MEGGDEYGIFKHYNRTNKKITVLLRLTKYFLLKVLKIYIKKADLHIWKVDHIDVLSRVGSVTIIFKYAPLIKLASTFYPTGKIVSTGAMLLIKSGRVRLQYFDISFCSMYTNSLPIFYQFGGIFHSDNCW